MGNTLIKCKECFQSFKQKPKVQIQTHQLVNFSNNPAEETQGKIKAQQISFTQDPTQSNERTMSQADEKNENDITLETIPNKQLSALRSPQMNSNQNQNEQEQFILNEECKTNPNLDSPYPLSFKEGELILLPSRNNINVAELKVYAEDALKKIIEIINKDFNDGISEYLLNNNQIESYVSHKMRNKKMFLIIKFSFELNTNITTFLNWLDGKQLINLDLINTYNLQQLNEEVSIGQIILNRQGMVKQQEFNYFKFIRQIDENYYVVFQSLRFQDKFEEDLKQIHEGCLNLGGLKISQKNNSNILIKGYIDADFGIKIGFPLTLKTIRDKIVISVNKLREMFN
ncbi:unnamed protein product [Paramecium sonneborni]|uniref:Uncharacterized protein n=1 Tax=Paramecium sonneborni TaxID=65129 RepID=A0A8S1PEP8_9CILI|nr:unnamed protein product [Paramecium sonneborni]